VSGVEGDVVAEPVLGCEGVDLVTGDALAHSAVRIDGGRDAVVGGAEKPAPVFNSAHANHVEVLPWSAGIAIPGVVTDVDEDFCAELSEVAYFIRKDCFVADEDAIAMAVEAEGGAIGSAAERGDFAGELVREGEVLLERDVFAEGNEVDLVVSADAVAVLRNDDGGVEILPLLLIL